MLSINWKGYRCAAWIEQTLLGIAVLAAVFQGKWQNAIVCCSWDFIASCHTVMYIVRAYPFHLMLNCLSTRI